MAWYDDLAQNQDVLTAIDPIGIGLRPFATPQVTMGTATGANPYTPQLQEALGGLTGRKSAADTLTQLNLDRLQRSGSRGMRGGDPMSAAITLGQLAPSQTRVSQAGARAVGAEQQKIAAIRGGAYGRAAQFALNKAMAQAARGDTKALVNLGLTDQAAADLAKRASVFMEQGAEALGRYQKPQKVTDPLSSEFDYGTYATDVYEGGRDTYQGPRDYSESVYS